MSEHIILRESEIVADLAERLARLEAALDEERAAREAIERRLEAQGDFLLAVLDRVSARLDRLERR